MKDNINYTKILSKLDIVEKTIASLIQEVSNLGKTIYISDYVNKHTEFVHSINYNFFDLKEKVLEIDVRRARLEEVIRDYRDQCECD